MLEVGVLHAVGEALSTDANALKYTVAGQLMHDQSSVNNTWQPINNYYLFKF